MFDYGIGIDCHSKFYQACLLFKNVERFMRYEITFPAEWQEILKAKSKIQKKLDEYNINEGKFRYTLESSGVYHKPILYAWKGEPTVINPLLAGSTKRKTDVLDARLLAQHSITGLWRASFIAPIEFEYIRRLCKRRTDHVREATRCFNQCNGILTSLGYTFGAAITLRSAKWREAVYNAIEGVETGNRYASDIPIPAGLCEELKYLILCGDNATEASKRVFQQLRGILGSMCFTAGGKVLNGERLFHLLTTCPGVGETTATVWLSEICTTDRFQSVKQCTAYCGCDPSLKVSAGKVTSHVRRHGNLRLNYALRQAATLLLNRHNEPFGLWGWAIYKRSPKGGYKKAVGAVSRRIAESLFYIHSRFQEFTYAGYRFNKELTFTSDEIPKLHHIAKRTLETMGISTLTQVAENWENILTAKGIGKITLSILEEALYGKGTGSKN